MAFGDFKFPQVQHDLGLTLSEADLFPDTEPLSPRADFLDALRAGARVGLRINTEKARSEFLIAPVLLELHRLTGEAFGLFSGVDLDGDASQGPNGICDFILTRSPVILTLSAPPVTIVEAKNDNVVNGLGQCIAAMVAARMFNDRSGTPIPALHGVSATGSAWKFLRLEGNALTSDTREYYISEVGYLLAILRRILTGS